MGARPALLRELNSSYSVALYGAPGSLPLQACVIWPALLTTEAVRSLQGAVACRWRLQATPGSFYLRGTIVQPAPAVMVHQASAALVPSHGWAEVLHCSYIGAVGGDQVSGMSPMWFSVAPGSGLSVNVGRTLTFDASSPSPIAEQVHRAAVSGDFYRLDQLLFNRSRKQQDPTHFWCWRQRQNRTLACYPDLLRFDSLQFAGRRQGSGQRWTELVMLAWGHEIDFSTAHLQAGRIVCGRHPHLRTCLPTDAAPRMQGPSCLRAVRRLPTIMRMHADNNCDAPPSPLAGDFEARADAEAERITAEYGLGLSGRESLESEALGPVELGTERRTRGGFVRGSRLVWSVPKRSWIWIHSVANEVARTT